MVVKTPERLRSCITFQTFNSVIYEFSDYHNSNMIMHLPTPNSATCVSPLIHSCHVKAIRTTANFKHNSVFTISLKFGVFKNIWLDDVPSIKIDKGVFFGLTG